MNRFLFSLALICTSLLPAAAQTPAFQFIDDEAEPNVNIIFSLKLAPEAAKGGSMTVAFDFRSPTNYYALDFAPGTARFRSVIDGKSRVLSGASIPWANGSKVTLQRRPWSMQVLVENRAVLTAYDAAFNSGRIGINGAGGWYWQNYRVQPVDDAIYFTDDFTRVADAKVASEWKAATGKWELTSSSEKITQRNIEMSANPFSYRVNAADAPAFTQAGRWYWDNYSAQVSVRPGAATGKSGSVGLAVYVRDAKNYLAFVWSSNEGPEARRLMRVVDGKATVVAKAPGAYLPRQWYRLGMRTSPGTVEAFIDGMPVFRVREPAFGQGAIALLAENVAIANFDDARVESYAYFAQDLSSTGKAIPWAGGAWQSIGGNWRADKGVLQSASAANEAGATRVVVAGAAAWDGYEVSASGRTGSAGACGVVGGYRDDKNYIVFRWAGANSKLPFRGRQQLLRYHLGKAQILSDEPATLQARADGNGFTRVRLRFASGAVTAYAGDEIVAQAADEAIETGKPGLWAQGTSEVAFRDVVLFFPPEPEKPKVAPKMEDDAQMVGWASPSGEWPPQKVKTRLEYWNTGDFYGDTWVEVPWRRTAFAVGYMEIALRARREQFDSGYVLRCQASPSTSYLKLTLSRGGLNSKPLKQVDVNLQDLPADAATPNPAATPSPAGATVEQTIPLRIELEGRAILVRAAGRPVLSYLLSPEEAKAATNGLLNTNTCVGVRSMELMIPPKELRAFSAHRDDYTFTEAPIDWYAPQGDWSVFSRWPCYSDWSFFGGKGLAPVLWNKRVYRGDTVVEMYAHNQMDLPKEIAYSRPGDLNITIAGDGKNPASGYSFIVAGWSNTRTRIYKGTQMVAESTASNARFARPINHNYAYHKRWYYIRAEVRQMRKDDITGVQVRLLMDDDVLAEYFDPTPLPALTNGGRVALWSVNSSIMIARTKIESAEMGGRVLPGGLLDVAPAAPARTNVSGLVARPVVSDDVPSSLVEALDGGWSVRNPVTGGRFGLSVTKAGDEAWKVERDTRLEVEVSVPADVKIDCYAVIDGTPHLITLTGNERPDARAALLGAATMAPAENGWRRATFGLGAALAKLYPDATLWSVKEVVFGALHGDEYRWVGFGGNGLGAQYKVRNVRMGS